MKRVDSVISLIYSLSKSEKKHFSLQVIKDKEEKDYLVIYDIIIKSKQPKYCKRGILQTQAQWLI